LERAWKHVRSNKGAGGVDGETIASFDARADLHLHELHRLLREKRYVPSMLRRVYIPKGNAELRPLGIPTLGDRVVQQAVRQVIEPIFEALFHEHSYGFRPDRSAHQALRRVCDLLEEGRRWIVDVDIRKYFDTVNHELLLDALNEEISDGSVLGLIRAFLEAGALEDGVCRSTEKGTPQGGVISPLLANIYLNRFDWAMSEAGYQVVRYADDMVVLCESAEEAQASLALIRTILEGHLHLQLHPEKTRIVDHDEEGFEFLGYFIHRKYMYPRRTSVEKFKARVRMVTRRQQPRNLRMVIRNLNPLLRGFMNYFYLANMKGLSASLDGWIRMRLRCFVEKKKAVKHQNRRISNASLAGSGLVSLLVLYESSPVLPAMGQPYRKAVYGKSVRTV
jgi:group II intron reverse transcriptase/maturase